MPRSTKVLRKIFVERHWEWMACCNPEGFRSGEVWRTWNKRHTALMNLVRRAQEIRTAPKGKHRIVHVGTRNNTPERYADYANIASAKKALDGMVVAQYREMKVYDDQGKEVVIDRLSSSLLSGNTHVHHRNPAL